MSLKKVYQKDVVTINENASIRQAAKLIQTLHWWLKLCIQSL